GGERARDGARDVERLGDAGPPAGEVGGEVLAFEPLHDEEGAALGLAVVDVPDDAGVLEAGEEARLVLEALAPVGGVRVEDLEGDGGAGGLVDGAVDRPHAAGAGEALDGEAAGDDVAGAHGWVSRSTR